MLPLIDIDNGRVEAVCMADEEGELQRAAEFVNGQELTGQAPAY